MRSRRGKSWLVAGIDDGTDVLQCVWFQGISLLAEEHARGRDGGRLGRGAGQRLWQIIHPAVDRLGESGDRELYNTGRIISLYPGNLSSAQGRDWKARPCAASCAPRSISPQREIWMSICRRTIWRRSELAARRGVRADSFPRIPKHSSSGRVAARALRRTVLLSTALCLSAAIKSHRRPAASPLNASARSPRKCCMRCRLNLTEGQKQVLHEIRADLQSPVPMQRLLQGEVGSGKTTVALLAMAMAADSGFQSVMMAPTELLAEQHAQKILPIAKQRDCASVCCAANRKPPNAARFCRPSPPDEWTSWSARTRS